MSLLARSISTAGWFLILPASLYSHRSRRTCGCIKARQTQASIKSTLTPSSLRGVLPSFEKGLPGARVDTQANADTELTCLRSLIERAGRCVTGTIHLAICFSVLHCQILPPSVPQSRTGWNTSPIMGRQLIMHYQLVPLATDRCLAGGTRPFCSFRTILSSSPLILLFPSAH